MGPAQNFGRSIGGIQAKDGRLRMAEQRQKPAALLDGSGKRRDADAADRKAGSGLRQTAFGMGGDERSDA
ncbi:hypothetical protein D1872_343480 [compost metagenome]